ncbi:hypothetical protein ZWY2020_051150 [Hordeum vulgare]|nr:hypothetical protein ZWY2020_051150 [Hordeum vulgare]
MDFHFVAAHDTDCETVGASRAVLQRPANTDQMLDALSNRTPNDDNANEDEGMSEVMSTSQQPTTMMRFDTLEDAEKHYKMYARQKGFGVRYCFRKKSKASGELIRASLVCHRAGLKIKKKVDTQNPQPIAPERWRNTTERTNCPARMFVKRRDNAWVVREINDDHNHPLIKKWSLTGFLRSHRHIPEEEQQFVKLLHSCNLEPSRQMHLLTELHGQREAIGYTDKDLANLLPKFRAEHKYTGASSARSASAAAARAPAMSNNATPGVYTAEAAAGSNNQGISSHAAASDLQIQGQNASMSVMGPYAWPMAAATDAICTPVDGSDKQHHSSHVVAPEPIIRDPEKSNTKGRKRKKSFQHPLNIGKR